MRSFSCFSPNWTISEQKSWMHSFKSLKENTMPYPEVRVFIGRPLFRAFVRNTWIEVSLLTISKCWCLLTSSNKVAQNLYFGSMYLSILLLHISKLLQIAAFWPDRATMLADMNIFSTSSWSTNLWHCCFKYSFAASSLWIWEMVLISSGGACC